MWKVANFRIQCRFHNYASLHFRRSALCTFLHDRCTLKFFLYIIEFVIITKVLCDRSKIFGWYTPWLSLLSFFPICWYYIYSYSVLLRHYRHYYDCCYTIFLYFVVVVIHALRLQSFLVTKCEHSHFYIVHILLLLKLKPKKQEKNIKRTKTDTHLQWRLTNSTFSP